MSKVKLIPVLITTDSSKRGVFMGYIKPEDADKETFEAENIRMAVMWSKDVRGVLGLAAGGPSKYCRISPAVPKGILKGVVATFQCTDEAVKAWEKEPWAQ